MGGDMINKKEFSNIFNALKSCYVQNNFLRDSESLEFWYELLKEYDYKIMQQAVIKYIKSKSFPPTPADLKKYYDDLCISNICKKRDSNNSKIKDNKDAIECILNDIRFEESSILNNLTSKYLNEGVLKTSGDLDKDIQYTKLYLSLLGSGMFDFYNEVSKRYRTLIKRYEEKYGYEYSEIVECCLPWEETEEKKEYDEIRSTHELLINMRKRVLRDREFLNMKEFESVKKKYEQIESLEHEISELQESNRKLSLEIRSIKSDYQISTNKPGRYLIEEDEEYYDEEYYED